MPHRCGSKYLTLRNLVVILLGLALFTSSHLIARLHQPVKTPLDVLNQSEAPREASTLKAIESPKSESSFWSDFS